MRVEVYSDCIGPYDFEPLSEFIWFLHNLRVIKRVSLNPGYFMADAAANTLTPLPQEHYVRLVYEKWYAK